MGSQFFTYVSRYALAMPTTYINLSTYPGVDPTGATDSSAAVAAALASVAGTNTTLMVDCPVLLDIQYYPARTIFIRTGTSVFFLPTGKFILTNSQVPGFMMLGVNDVYFYNANIQWAGTNALTYNVAPYIAPNGSAAFNSTYALGWMNGTAAGSSYASNPCSFTGSGAAPNYVGPGELSAVFCIQGACKRIRFYNTRAYVSDATTADQYMLWFCSVDWQYLPGTAVTPSSVPLSSNIGAPDVAFYGAYLDGYYMGFSGCASYFTATDIVGNRYSDLQDNSYLSSPFTGGTQGGTGQWLAPPHLFYVKSPATSGNLGVIPCVTNITNVQDLGVYIGGTQRRQGGGALVSCKVEPASGSTIDGYTTLRPDGGLTLLSFGYMNGVVKNIHIEFNTTTSVSAVSGIPSVGLAAPSVNGLVNLAIENVSIIDTAAVPAGPCITRFASLPNQNISMTGMKVYQNDYPAGATYTWGMGILGINNTIDIEYYFVQCNSTQVTRGPFDMQGGSCFNSICTARVYGWRYLTVTFSATLSSGATTATLAANWTWPTGTYRVYFSDNKEWRDVLFTNGSTTLGTWAALSNAQTTAANATGLLSQNFNSYKARMNTGVNAASQGNSFTVIDVQNNYQATSVNNFYTETWTQEVVVTPTAGVSSFATTIIVPSTMSIVGYGWNVQTALGTSQGLTGVNVGWTGSTSALISNAAITVNTDPVIPQGNPISLGGSSQTILLTAIGGNFDGTGSVVIVVKGQQFSING